MFKIFKLGIVEKGPYQSLRFAEGEAAISAVEAQGDCFVPAAAGPRNDVTRFFNKGISIGKTG